MADVRRILIAPLLALLVGSGCAPGDGAGVETVEIAGESFRLEVVNDEQSRNDGMMGRTEFPPAGGMLFVFPDTDVRWFWMKNCVIDMDLVFLDARGSVTAVHRMVVEPERGENESEAEYESRLGHYSSVFPAQFAIELESGTTERLNVRVDDRVEIDLDRLKAAAK